LAASEKTVSADERRKNVVDALIREHLAPHVKRIDAESFYPADYLKSLGAAGLLDSRDASPGEVRARGVRLVEETSKICMTTGFNLWCHLAALTYVRGSGNEFLRQRLLPELENGKLLGGTGLSNPMKFYAGMDKLILQAEVAEGGYRLSGTLPMVSNLADGHWFGVVASLGDSRRVMAFVPCAAEGLKRTERIGYLGLNGSATFACEFSGVLAPRSWIVAEEADAFVARIRPLFILYQIPLGLGVIDASIRSMERVRDKQRGCNRFLREQPETLEDELRELREQTYRLASTERPESGDVVQELLGLRLKTAYLALRAVQADMLHGGGSAYLRNSAPSRRLREAYFFANLTPTIKHLEKMRQSGSFSGTIP